MGAQMRDDVSGLMAWRSTPETGPRGSAFPLLKPLNLIKAGSTSFVNSLSRATSARTAARATPKPYVSPLAGPRSAPPNATSRHLVAARQVSHADPHTSLSTPQKA